MGGVEGYSHTFTHTQLQLQMHTQIYTYTLKFVEVFIPSTEAVGLNEGFKISGVINSTIDIKI